MARNMKGCLPAARPALITLSLVLALLAPGCGGKSQLTMRDELVSYTIQSIVIPLKHQPTQLVVLQRYPVEDPGAGPEAINEKMWKIEDGTASEISQEEFDSLKSARDSNNDLKWMASQHSIRILGLDEEAGSAVLEVDSLYGPMAVEGVVYRLEYRDGAWKVTGKASAF